MDLKEALRAEIDISVSKLLGFKTFAKSLRVSISEKKSRFRKNLVPEKSLGFGFRKFGFGKKVSVSVLTIFGLGKKSRFRFRNNLVSEKVSVSVSENLVSENKKSK